jgi:hypothetical protein
VTDPRDLYGLPLDRFVPERGALAKALRGQGDREQAARVAALRKPSVAAWTVNQLVRTQRRAVGAAFDAGDELQRAQADLLAGTGDAGALREATQRERRAVEDLAEVARGLLSSDGHEPTTATLDRVSETLHAAALNEDARAQVRDACLERELRRVGFGEAAGALPSTGPARSRDVAPGGGAKRDDRAERERSQRAERERAEQLASARKAEAAARRVAERAARELQTAKERRDRAAGSLRDAEDELAATSERAEEAVLAYQRAQEALARI